MKGFVCAYPHLNEKVDFPHRFTTRPIRSAEDAEETTVISKRDFFEKISSGLINLHWERKLPGVWDEPELYGFSLGEKPILILSGNNALINSKAITTWPHYNVTKLLIRSPKDLCLSRLKVRSPEILEEERNARLIDDEALLVKYADIIITNDSSDLNDYREKVCSTFGLLLNRIF